MITEADGKQNAADFAVPISVTRRITDFAVLVGGVLIIVYSIRVGDAAFLLLPFGIAVSGAGLWLLSRKKRRLPPPKLAKRFGAALAERIGNAASTPEGRSHYIHEYLKGVQELKQLTDGVWEVAGRGMHGDYEAIVHFRDHGYEEACVVAAKWAVGFYAKCGYQEDLWDSQHVPQNGRQMRKKLATAE